MDKRRGDLRKEYDKVVAADVKQCNHDSEMVNELVKRNYNINTLDTHVFLSFDVWFQIALRLANVYNVLPTSGIRLNMYEILIFDYSWCSPESVRRSASKARYVRADERV